VSYYRDAPREKDRDYRDNSNIDLSFLTSFFEDSKKEIIRKDLLDKKAYELGKRFAKRKREGGDELSSSQLRNFFNDVRSLEAKVRAEDFPKVMPHIKMLKAKVAYAEGRGKVPTSFKALISKCVDLIEDKKDFEGFVKFFEAIVGFFYGEGGGKNR
jgi:CRISPR-associated protein Csm2